MLLDILLFSLLLISIAVSSLALLSGGRPGHRHHHG